MPKHISVKQYIIGFILSLVLTFSAYFLTLAHTSSFHKVIPHDILITSILVLAIFQLVVQLGFFLHLWSETKPRWNLIFFVSTLGIVLIVVIGAIWIMNHLNYNMTPMQINQYIQSQDGF